MTGRFIAFEGGEGAGKSTQSRMLAEALEARNIPVITTREPGGTPGAEAIRALLLHPPGEGAGRGWGAKAEALLFAAARSDHVERLIRPALKEGRWVICDRFVDSSRAYQGWAGGLGDTAIQGLHAFGSDGLRPDLTILLEVPANQADQRLRERDGDTADAIGGRGADYHRKVAEGFAAIAADDPLGFARIDGSGDPAAIHARVMAAIAPFMTKLER